MVRYAVADLHGQLDLLTQIKEYINEDDILYVLGDSGDRGPEPWRTLKLCLDDPQIVYLMGNHDRMLVDAIEFYMERMLEDGHCFLFNYMYVPKNPFYILFLNGAIPTFEGWQNELPQEQMRYYNMLRRLPYEIRLAALDGSYFIYLNHAGVDPDYIIDSPDELLWDRKHFLSDWYSDNSDIVIGGHTPTEFIIKKLSKGSYDLSKGYLSYNNGKKLCIDIGACFYNKTILVNIDTLKGKIFTTGENNGS